MKVETSKVTKLLITNLMGEPFRLDPVTAFLEDLGSRQYGDNTTRQGKVIIECYGKSWSSYWGGMGDRTVAQFFINAGDDYLIGCLAPRMGCSRFSGSALVTLAKKTVISRRVDWRHRNSEFSYLDRDDCRRLFDHADELSGVDNLEQAVNWHGELLNEIFDTEEPWHYACDATEPNPDYLYLQRIVAAVQQALAEPEESSEAA